MSQTNVDVLLLSALTEEQQVVHAVLRHCAEWRGDYGELPHRVTLYETPDSRYLIATACVHDMGGVPMAASAASLFGSGLRPECTVLVGIAATVSRKDVDLADVPVAAAVFSADDIKVERGRLSVRPRGYTVDPRLQQAAGVVRENAALYRRWQTQCTKLIPTIVAELNADGVRRPPIKRPARAKRPRLVVEVGAGGPFLIKSAPVLRALKKGSTGKSLLRVDAVHQKLAWVEMEAHGFMEAAKRRELPAIVMKGICDAGDSQKTRLEEKTGGFFRVYGCSNAVLALLHMLKQRPRPPIPPSRRLAIVTPARAAKGKTAGAGRSARPRRAIDVRELGQFPSFFADIIAVVGSAKAGETVHIACDYVAYGLFSAGELFEQYLSALERALRRGCALSAIVHGSKALRDRRWAARRQEPHFPARRQHDDQFEKCLLALGKRLGKTPGLRAPDRWSYAGLVEALADAEEAYTRRLQKLGASRVEVQITPRPLPVYLWISPSRAVWAIPPLAPSKRLETDWYTRAARQRGELPFSERGYASVDEEFAAQLRFVWEHYERDCRGLS